MADSVRAKRRKRVSGEEVIAERCLELSCGERCGAKSFEIASVSKAGAAVGLASATLGLSLL